tara:strand:+ start:1143 stop:8645 length:7503 start_codon:yes stop_codon:yes gene_type:complete
MPEIKHTFTSGKMNKDLDERIVPNGEYRDASNIQVRTTDGDAAGTVQGIKGNTSIGSYINAVNPTTGYETKTIGNVVDEKNDNIYFFMAAPPVDNIDLANVVQTTFFTDSIIEQNVAESGSSTTPVIIDEHTIITTPDILFGSGTNSDNFTNYVGDYWYRIKIPNDNIRERLKVGMTMELLDANGENRIPNAVIKNIEGLYITLYKGFTLMDISPFVNDGDVWIKFSSPKVLNFNYDSKITGINIIDNLLFWTDGTSEPKKINIDRCKAGTNVDSTSTVEYVYNGDFSENLNLTNEWYTQGNALIGSTIAPSVYQGDAVVETEYLVNGDFSEDPGSEYQQLMAGGWQVIGNYQFNASPSAPSINWTGDISNDADIGGNSPYNYGVSYNQIGHWNYNGGDEIAATYGGEMKQTGLQLTVGESYTFSVTYSNTGPDQLRVAFNQTGGTQTQHICTGTGTLTETVVVDGTGQCSVHIYAGSANSALTSGYIYNISVKSISPLPPFVGKLYLNGLEDWNDDSLDNPGYSQYSSGATGGNGDLVHLVEGLTPGESYTFSFDYEVLQNILKVAAYNVFQTSAGSALDYITQEFTTTSGTNGDGIGTFTMNVTAITEQMNIHFSGTDTQIASEGAVKAYIDNVSVSKTITTPNPHTKLYVQDPNDLSSQIFIPITDIEHYNFEGDKVDDNLKEEHITVIRKAPLRAPTLTLNSTDRGEGQSEVSISNSPFVSVGGDSLTATLAKGDTRIFTDDNLMQTIFRLNDTLIFKGYQYEYDFESGAGVMEIAIDPLTGDPYVDADGVPTGEEVEVFPISEEYEIKITCKFISYLDEETSEETPEATSKIKVEVIGLPTSEYFSGAITDWFVQLKQKDPLFELKMGRFAYRYKYEDGEYSSIGPWSELAFLPGEFDYEAFKGHNLGMKNNVREIIIKDFIPFKNRPLDVKSVDILYKPTDEANCYVVKTLSRGVDAEWALFTPTIDNPTTKLSGQLNITSEMIHNILSEDQLLRAWDNVPRYAKSQEITSNRLLFANYEQGYNVQLPIGLSQEVISNNITSIKAPHKSIKSVRDYKWGMVFGDEYGRETPVFSSGFTVGYDDNYSSVTGDISLDQQFSSKRNHFRVKQQWSTPHNSTNTPPDWANYVKYYVKETSNEYYNLVLNRWYWADDSERTVWLSFQSTDRNKIDEETYLVAKSRNGEAKPIEVNSRYKVLAIENEAPDFIKTKHNIIGKIEATAGDYSTFDSIWSGGNSATITSDSPDKLVSPDPEVGQAITITTIAWQGIFGITGSEVGGAGDLATESASRSKGKMSFRIVGEDDNAVRKFTDWSEITNHRLKEEMVDADMETLFEFSYATAFGESANMVARFLADANLNYSGSSVPGLQYYMEFKEEIVENKPEFDGRFFVKVEADNLLLENVMRMTKIDQKYVSVGTFDLDYIESESKSSAVSGPYVDEIWEWGQGDGWWHNAFDVVDQWTDFSGGYYWGNAWDEGQCFNCPSILTMANTGTSGIAQFSYASAAYDPGPVVPVEGPGNPGDADYLGMKSGFAFYCWTNQTQNFWTSRKENYFSRPFIDAAGLAGTKGYSYQIGGGGYGSGGPQGAGYYPDYYIIIGEGTDYESGQVITPPGLDVGEITETLSYAMGLGGATTPLDGNLGRMCIAVCHYGSYSDLTSAHQLFFEKIGEIGTRFRFTADPDNIYVIISSVEYSDEVGNFHRFDSTHNHIEVSLNYGNHPNHRIGKQIQFRRLDSTTGVITNYAIDPEVFDPRGHCRHDGTVSTPIEILRRVSEGGEAMTFDSNASIFETEPKKNIDIDVYYEGSNSIPLRLNENNIYNYIPANCGMSIERPTDITIENVMLPNDISSDPFNSPTHIINNVVATPKVFNEGFVSDGTILGDGDPIVHVVNKSIGDGAGETVINQNHGIYVGDNIVFYHKNGIRTRSKITGFFDKNEVTEDGNIVSSYYTPVSPPIVGVIQANPDADTWTQTITDGTNDWDPACGNYIFTVSMINSGFIGPGDQSDLVAGMQMVGYVEVDTDTGEEIAGTEGVAPPGIVVAANTEPNNDGNYILLKLTSSTDKPFYFQDDDGTPQTWDEFNDTGANEMGKRFKVEFIYPPTGYYSIDKNVWQYPVDLNWYNCYSFGNGVESDRVREDFNAPQINNGVKASTTFSGYRKENKTSGLIYSGLYNSTSGTNNLNEFNMSQKITKDLNPSYGSVQRLKTRDTDVIVFTEDKILKVLSSKDALFNADGNPQLTATDKVLGTAMPFVGDYGISKNPESLAWDQYRMYFADKQRGAVLRLSQDGLTPISNVGMKTWFRDNLKSAHFALGSFDTISGEYNLTLTKKDGDSTYDTTVSFSEESKGWVSFKTFIPEAGNSVSGEYITAKGNAIYKHYSNSTYNNFYGTQYDSKISVLFNDIPSAIKSFNSINYEGSQSRVIQNLSDTGEYYNLENKEGWYVSSFETDKQSGTVPEFIEKEGKWFNKINGVASTLANLDPGEFTVQGIGNPTEVSSIYIQ